jgi:hypothetical protein
MVESEVQVSRRANIDVVPNVVIATKRLETLKRLFHF